MKKSPRSTEVREQEEGEEVPQVPDPPAACEGEGSYLSRGLFPEVVT